MLSLVHLLKNLSKGATISLGDIGKVLSNFRLLLVLLITALGYGGIFVVYTYISPVLKEFMGYSDSAIVLILVIYGVMVAIGNTIGGRLSNNRPLRAVFFVFILTAFNMLLILAFLNFHLLGLFAVLLMGLFSFMNVAGLQLLAVQLAEKYVPNAIAMASALNISAFNIGIALGSYIGGRVITTVGLQWTPLFGFIMVFIAAIITLIWLLVDREKK